MRRDEKTQPRVLIIFIGLVLTAIALIVVGATREPKPPAATTASDAGSDAEARPFPALLHGLEPDGGALLDAQVRAVDWREGDSIVLRFERIDAPPTTLEVRLFDGNAPAPLAHTTTLAVYVMDQPDSGTAIRDEALATALGEFLSKAEAEGRPIPQLLPLH
jgi:hypothetical protein